MGSPGSMTRDAACLIEKADLIIASQRILDSLPPVRAGKVSEYRAGEIRRIVDGADESEILILVTGDQGFYSAAGRIGEALKDYDPTVLPGISSVSYFSSRIEIPYSDANIVSAHGKKINIVSEVRRNPVTFVLGGGNIGDMLEKLCQFGMGGLETYVGEDLSYKSERLLKGRADELVNSSFGTLSLMCILNPSCDSSVPSGLPDELFVRGRVPMTKRVVRTYIQSELRLRPDSVICDIGAGTGSVSVESALQAYKGCVYAVEKNQEACGLIEKNAVKFQADNINIVMGEAPEALEKIPLADVDAFFIGGSGGHLDQIIDMVGQERSRCQDRKYRIVLTAATIQTLGEACRSLEGHRAENISYTQVQASSSYRVGPYDMMKAENPVWIISAVL